VAAVAFVVLAWLVQGPEAIVIQLLSPGTALTVLILVVLLGLWRLVAMVDALSSVGGEAAWRRPRTWLTFVILALAVVVSHAVVGTVAWSFYQAGSRIFVGEADADVTPRPSTSAAVADLPVATPNITPETKESRINILLLGIDSSERRNHALTDTLLVVSIDPESRKVAMVSFPRDIARFPLWTGGTFPNDRKINSLMTYADAHRDQFPDGGLTSLTKELGYLLGVPIHYYAAINLDGFEAMINRVGGVTIDNKTAINDPTYGGWKDGRIGFHLSKGTHTLDGETALAYVRSRRGAGDNDFTRARRQQELLLALERKLSDPQMLPNLPGLLEDASRTITTNFPADRLSEMLVLGREVDDETIVRKVLGPPYATRPPSSSEYILVLDPERLAKLSIELFGNDSRYATAAGATAP
jgi:LCP family protein required for cell wall assembly